MCCSFNETIGVGSGVRDLGIFFRGGPAVDILAVERLTPADEVEACDELDDALRILN